jgi:hypothetical protein
MSFLVRLSLGEQQEAWERKGGKLSVQMLDAIAHAFVVPVIDHTYVSYHAGFTVGVACVRAHKSFATAWLASCPPI